MATAKKQSTAITSLDVRNQLVEALRLDLVGPWPGHPLAEEKLPGWMFPSNWYLTGFLIPSGTPPENMTDPTDDDDLDVVPESAGLSEENTEEGKPAKRAYFPSSMGLSFLVSARTDSLRVKVNWGDYTHIKPETDDGQALPFWQRIPQHQEMDIPLRHRMNPATFSIHDSKGLQICVVEREISSEEFIGHLPSGTRSVSVFLVNHRTPIVDVPDTAYIFQPELEILCEFPFVPRPNPRGTRSEDWDDLVADLHYADTPSYATGHGVSADWKIVGGTCCLLKTIWIPDAEVEKTITSKIEGVELSMDALGSLQDAPEVERALKPLTDEYLAWIESQKEFLKNLSATRLETATELLRNATIAAGRIDRGINILATDPDALDAFRMANRAVSRALKHRLKVDNPRWHPFQLAFILLNLPGIADPTDAHRETVDLLYFPTGGGKTEAYLGLAAFAMVMRRLHHPGEQCLESAGVSVIMRYTLRLLTLDQLGRAAGLVCALELERENNPKRYGIWPFEIGLWVGKAATPNKMGHKGDGDSNSARAKVSHFKSDPKGKPSPIPIETCPWCGAKFEPEAFSLLPDSDNPRDLRIVCSNFECDFSRDRPLPIVAVDEPIYRRLPAFLIATLDKFASLPWVGPSGVILGGADRFDKNGFYGDANPGIGKKLSNPLPPVDLIIQDELHLISGPLGTMAGLYETAIEALCIRKIGDRKIRPKIVASTATVRRAQDQIHALFAHPLTQIFPPPGPSRRDSFFARTVSSSETNARMYLGIAPQGRNPKEVMRRVWLALMGAAEKAYKEAGGKKNTSNPADPYMTVLGYFNSLRELGGARRVIEEQIQNTLRTYGIRRRIGQDHGLFNDRKNFGEVMELTSRIPTNKVAEARRRLESQFHETQPVDCAIATNMISVGLDISRLGLMVVNGQPKTHSEYIQASSRVGRDDKRPGLVVTLLNFHKPRDRSHYEQFRHYHETFYRTVEAASVTPFAARALDRGFAGALVTLARHIDSRMTPPKGVMNIGESRTHLEESLLDAFLERVRQQPIDDEVELEERLRSVKNRIVDLLDSWKKIVDDNHSVGVELQYQKYELRNSPGLLREMLDKDFENEHCRKFKVNRSLRDVEPDVNLYLKELSGKSMEDPS